MLQGFIKTATRIRAQRKIEIEPNFNKTRRAKTIFILTTSLDFFQSIQSFPNNQISTSLPFTAIFTFQRVVSKLKDVKELKRPNVNYIIV